VIIHLCAFGQVDGDEASGSTGTKLPKAKPKKKEKSRPLEFAKYTIQCKFSDGRPSVTSNASGGEQSASTYTDFVASGAGTDDLPESMEIRVSFPRLLPEHRAKISIDMSHELVVISAPGYRRLELFLPFPAKRDTVAASFDGLVSPLFHTCRHICWCADDEGLFRYCLQAGGELVVNMDVFVERIREVDRADDTTPDEGSRPWLLVIF